MKLVLFLIASFLSLTLSATQYTNAITDSSIKTGDSVSNGAGGGGGGPTPFAWYKFDEGSGTSASDSSGNGHTGTLAPVDTPTWITGHINGAIQTINSDHSYVDVTSSSAFNLASSTSEFSAACWIKISTADAVILGWRDSSPGNPLIYFTIGSDPTGNLGTGKLAVVVRDDSGGGLKEVLGGTAVNTGSWVHICFTRNSSKLITIYVNGVSDGSGSDTMGTSLTVGNHFVGSDPGNSGFQGVAINGIDDLRFYNVALTQPQVAALAAM